MKTLTLIFILIFGLSVFGQSKKPTTLAKGNIQIEITDDGATSELLPIPLVMPPTISDAKIGIKYFGTNSESDISFVLLLKGTKSRYSADESFGVRIFVDDVPISSSKYRVVDKVDKDGATEIVHFYLTTEDLAWMATATRLKISIFNTDTDAKLDTFSFTPTGFAEIKKFAQSVYLIKSKF